MLYFSEVPVVPDRVDQRQYAALGGFKAWAQRQGLVETFDSAGGFREKFRRQLPTMLRDNPYLRGILAPRVAAPPAEPGPISEEARVLLKAAAADPQGSVTIIRTLAGAVVQAGQVAWGEPGNRRISAQAKAAVAELRDHGLLAGSGDHFEVTEAGYRLVDHGGDLSTDPQHSVGIEADRKTLAEIQVLMADMPDYFLSHPNFGDCSFSAHEIETFRAVVEKRNKPEHEFIDLELEELRWQFISEGRVLLGVMEKRLVPAPQQGWYRLPIQWRESAPDRLERVAGVLDQQAAKVGLAYHALIRAARRKLEN
jgi:hypothetical protein